MTRRGVSRGFLSLAKTVRDQHEAGKFVNRIADAKAERIIRELESP